MVGLSLQDNVFMPFKAAYHWLIWCALHPKIHAMYVVASLVLFHSVVHAPFSCGRSIQLCTSHCVYCMNFVKFTDLALTDGATVHEAHILLTYPSPPLSISAISHVLLLVGGCDYEG